MRRTNLAATPQSTLEDLFALNAERGRIQQEFQAFWTSHGIDALVMSGAATTATPLDEWLVITYTMLWNFFDYPAIIIPVGKVTENDLADGAENARHGERDEQNYRLCAYLGETLTVPSKADRTYRYRSAGLRRSAAHHSACRYAPRRRKSGGSCGPGRSCAQSRRVK